ncbi:MAG: hypothetical protein IT479_05010 [Xanthomonadales bacterium]|nr:hypothetical protein [Xanthomonadales bacterium]MCC6592616.1 hypothetical protein [Xanthomonadales bacterium]MCE7931956.1 hypothetical protein [Xanthomonadales bacterium PRO6]
MVLPECPPVLRLRELDPAPVAALLTRFGLRLVVLGDGVEIPGSYWGECEAGLVGDALYARPDTPLHSILHEGCHWITCTPERRASVHTDAADTEEEEIATCWLQIVLADDIPGFGRERAFADMDAWGYSFRLGSAKAWFEQDAADARSWLHAEGLIDRAGRCSYRVRGGPV